MSDYEDWMDPAWAAEPERPISPGLHNADLDRVKQWVVRLEFSKYDEEKGGWNHRVKGSGFIVNVPNVNNQLLILTAAHNLSNTSGTRCKNVTIIYNDPNATPSIGKYVVPDDDFYVSKTYKEKSPPSTDYGAVRIPDTSTPTDPKDRKGFGFSLRLAYEDYFSGNLFVSGLQDITPDGFPVTSTGSCIACYKAEVEYGVKTEPGISGSSVWMEYKGLQTAIAIHNNGPKSKTGGSRGARLTYGLLSDVFGWFNSQIIRKDVQLRAAEFRTKPVPPLLPTDGIFVSFKSKLGFARVRLRSGTKFDLIPAQCLPGSEPSYVLRVSAGVGAGGDVEEKWALFNIPQGEVLLSDTVKDACLFKIQYAKKVPPPWFKVIITSADGKEFLLKMEGVYIKEYDEDAESSEISFVPNPRGDKDLFTKFKFD